MAEMEPDSGDRPVERPDSGQASDRARRLIHAVLTARHAPLGQTPKDLVWRKNKSRLFRYRRETPPTRRTPVFLSMPLINRADILDLRPGGSFVEYLLSQGFDVFMYDWGAWGPEDRNLTIRDLLSGYLSRAVARAADEAESDLTILGYCIGGTLAACYTALNPEGPAKNLVLFTTPIDFSDAGEFGAWTARGAFPIELIREVLPIMPGELIDLGAKMLNPVSGWIGTYLNLWEKLGDPGFDVQGWQAMYRWVNEGVPFPGTAFYQWITEFYQQNKLVKGTFRVNGEKVRLSSIRVPLLNVAALADAIAPRPMTAPIMDLVSSTDREEALLEGGHIGIVIGRTARGNLWPKVADWLARHD